MAALCLFLLLLSTFSILTTQQKTSNISLDSSLSPITRPSSWLSPSGQFAFGFYPLDHGLTTISIWFARIPEKTIIWTANRDDPQVSNNVTLLLTSNGGLILRSPQGDENLITHVSGSISSASMLDSGNFVLYSSDLKIIWQSFEHPTNTILQGQTLVAGRELFSNASQTDPRKGRFRLKMQTDGNLVQYPVQTPDSAPYSYYSTGTFNAGDNVTLNLDKNGYLYLLNGTGFNIRNLTDGMFPSNETMFYRLTLDVDGIFRLYSNNLDDQNGNWSIKLESSNDKCVAKGLCGLNGFCTLMDQAPLCLCPRGFDYIDQAQMNLGCKYNASTADCSSKEEHIKYTIYTTEKTIWEDDPYNITSSATQKDCEDNCLSDCNCEAAIFRNSECRKQRLPLRYGKRDKDESGKVLVKGRIMDNSVNNDDDPSTRSKLGKERNKELRIDILIASIVVLTFSLVVIGICGVIIYKQRVWAYKRISDQANGLSEGISLRSFTYNELDKATDGFKEELGRGSFGIVFKGSLWNGERQEVIAVKRLERVLDEGEREFKNEMRVIGRTHHRNLVRLLGYCHEGPNRLLVYEYMSNGSLANFVFSPEKCPNWDERVGISLNIARGLLYLHEECETQIIHCDIKPQNILMDEYNCAKIADFGLAKLMKPDQTRTYTGIRGTRGYVAPEWHRNMPVTVKADVYSFGIVLLEIVCCRRNLIMELVEEEIILVDWVYQCFENGEVGKLVKDEEVDKKRLERMVRVALWCIQDEPSLRPSMKKVVLMLEGTIEIPVPPGPDSVLSVI